MGDIRDSIKLKMAVAMSKIHDAWEGGDEDGEWIEVIGICKLNHEIVCRRVFDNGDVMQRVHLKGWVPVDMRDKGEFREATRRTG